MSDHDAAPDPIDKAYVEAETVLSDEAARAARREQVLAAVAREAEAAPAAPLLFTRRSSWRRGGWLAAAGVAGLGLILATQINSPAWRQPRAISAAPAAPTPAGPASAAEAAAASPPPAAASSQAPLPRAVAAVPRPVPFVLVQPPQAVLPPAPPAPEPVYVAPTLQPFPAALPPPPPQESVIGAAEGRSSREAMVDQDAARAAFPAPPASASGFVADAPSDQAARLRAAATAGRTAEVQALLARGVPVDGPDADGKTALMDSIQADRPAVAALLRRHGASLDAKDQSGESARDMATTKGDAALDQALGLAP
jgi:hypothetical protein